MKAIIVFSHLRWNFVYQRPQHLLTRLAHDKRIIFFEEPIFDQRAAKPFLESEKPHSNITVCRVHAANQAAGYHDTHLPYLNALLEEFIATEEIEDYAVWFYTPMALPLLQDLNSKLVVYDCMDELSAFLNAPRQLIQRETALLAIADVVFTGGASLYAAKKDRHPNVYCFPSSVDTSHFAKAKDASIDAPEQTNLAHPRLGFFGVIDERFDIELLDKLATAHPEWQLVMVGPVVKIDSERLPKHSNIHYLGQQDYKKLPQFLAGWDVCLLPFALNEATRFISPTKTLEYMAAEKPIVSTPITDVKQYSDIVYLADTHESFITACEEAINSSEAARALRIVRAREILSGTSWDVTAASMDTLLKGLEKNKPLMVTPPIIKKSDNNISPESVSTRALSKTPALLKAIPSTAPHVVLGAGPTGLSAAYHLGASSLLLEKNETVGGWCRSIEDNGFVFDYAGHIMFSNDPYVHQLYKMLLGNNVHWQEREAWIYSKNVYTRYPFQGALYGLPDDVIKECIVGAIEARFGNIGKKVEATATLKSSSPSACKPESITDCCADGILESTAPLGSDHILPFANRRKEPRNFEDFIYHVWGRGIAKHFAIPYNKKLWAVPLKEMETSWLGGRVPMPDLEEMIEGALKPVGKPMGPNARFGYPLKGGFQALMNGFLPHLEGQLKLKTDAKAVSPSKRTITLNSGEEISYQSLISTIPLPKLIQLIGDEAPSEIHEAANGLRHVSVRCVNLGIGRENISDKHWIYYPEDSVFHRIFVQGNASPHCNPPGGFGFTCEITYSEHKPLPCDGDALIKRCIEDCLKVGMIKPEDKIIAANQVDMPYAYVVYDHMRAKNVAIIRDWLAERGIILSGRYSEWEYYNSDHAFIAGKKAAEQVQNLHQKATSLRRA